MLRSWEAASISSVWLRPGDWYTPAAEALVEALQAGRDTAPAAFRLGQARGAAGVGITESIDDMAVLFRSAGFQSAPIRSIRSLCEGWTERDAAPVSAPTMADAESGLGTAEYQDEYTKTASGWRFASRTVIIAPEKAAGLDARELLAIDALGGARLGDRYEPDSNGVARLMTSGVRVSVSGTEVRGRAFLKDGGYEDEVYEKLGPGRWRVKSSVHVAE